MGKLVDVLGLIVFLAAVIGILCVVVRNLPMIGVIVGSVIATLGLGWGLVQIIGAVSGSASAQWKAGSSHSACCGDSGYLALVLAWRSLR